MTRDSVDNLKRFAARRNVEITLLSDKNSKVITAFGIRDDQYGTSGRYSAIAKPTIFVIAPDGTIKYRIDVDHYAPPPVDELVAALKGS